MLLTKKQPQKKTKASTENPQEIVKNSETEKKTRITINYDVGFNNHLFLRGQGAGLSWEKGVKLKNVKADEWAWETTLPFECCEFKVLINDQHYEIGENHQIKGGSSIKYAPRFS